MNKNYLYLGSGYSTWIISVSKGYLALRTAKYYDSATEIGELYTGDQVQECTIQAMRLTGIYSPKLGKYGYVNKNYLY